MSTRVEDIAAVGASDRRLERRRSRQHGDGAIGRRAVERIDRRRSRPAPSSRVRRRSRSRPAHSSSPAPPRSSTAWSRSSSCPSQASQAGLARKPQTRSSPARPSCLASASRSGRATLGRALAHELLVRPGSIAPGCPSPGQGVSSSMIRAVLIASTLWRSLGSNCTISPGPPLTGSPASLEIATSPLTTTTHARSCTWCSRRLPPAGISSTIARPSSWLSRISGECGLNDTAFRSQLFIRCQPPRLALCGDWSRDLQAELIPHLRIIQP